VIVVVVIFMIVVIIMVVVGNRRILFMMDIKVLSKFLNGKLADFPSGLGEEVTFPISQHGFNE
jgi:hypothetical protein